MIVDERQRLVARLHDARAKLTGQTITSISWLGSILYAIDDAAAALASPSEGNKMDAAQIKDLVDHGELDRLRALERSDNLTSRPQEQPRKATGEMDAWDQPEPLTLAKVAEWKAEAEELLFQMMEGPYSVILALCEHILSVSPAAPEGWQVVPKVPTPDIRQAIFNAIMGDEHIAKGKGGWWGTSDEVERVNAIYAAALAAAPPSPAQEQEK